MKAIYLILMVMMGFVISCKSNDNDCGEIENSPSPNTRMIKLVVKPKGTAKKVVFSSTDIRLGDIRFSSSLIEKNTNVKEDTRNKIEFEINENLSEQSEIFIGGGFLGPNTEYSFSLKIYEGSNKLFEKQVNIKTGMGEKSNECVWDEAVTTIEEVRVNDMQYVKKLAKKGTYFLGNEVIVLEIPANKNTDSQTKP